MARIDIELVNRKIVDTRSKAQEAIKNGIVYCNNKLVTKNSHHVTETDVLSIRGELFRYVSRGGLKLEKAINEFKINLKGKIMCDIGASTGGFSDCAIQNEIKEIYAVDVGSNQFHEKLRNIQNIHLYENTDFRAMKDDILKDVEFITIDVSFISVTKLMPKIEKLEKVQEIMCLVKPQFECGKENADKYKGIILNKEIHNQVINRLKQEFSKINFTMQGLTFSPIKGGSGNIEYLMYLNKNVSPKSINIQKVVKQAFTNKF